MATVLDTTEKFYTVEEWLEFEKTAEVRHEFYYGKLIPLIRLSRFELEFPLKAVYMRLKMPL